LERCWDLKIDDSKSESLIAISEENRSVRSDNINFEQSKGSFKNKRLIKLEKKLINRAAIETELARGRRTQHQLQGFKEWQTVTGVFCTLIYELKADCLDNLHESDQ